MKRLTLWTVALCTLFVALSTASVVVGRQNRAYINEAEALGLGLCNGMPCFMGIQPGVTSWTDIENGVELMKNAKVITRDDRSIDLIFQGLNVSIYKSRDQAKVSWIEFYNYDAQVGELGPLPLTVGSLLTKFGTPCKVRAEEGIILIRYPALASEIDTEETRWNIYIEKDRLNIEMPIWRIALDDGSWYSNLPDSEKYTPWLRFASLQRYISTLNARLFPERH